MEGRRIPLKLLLVEDSDDDALLLIRGLRRNGFDVTFERVDKETEMIRALDTQDWDVVISDYNLPQFDAVRALELSRQYDPDIPFIVVSGAIGEETAVSLMRSGVCDYVLKQNLNR
ncbi:MAG: response regulator, partial [Firmicutes bacterium]|nr:response regulator [Candidatus Fermentithermobacillaceae bacterium]